jgi:hypothetical protein
MLRTSSIDTPEAPRDRVSDLELAVAAVMVGVVVLLAAVLVPIVG